MYPDAYDFEAHRHRKLREINAATARTKASDARQALRDAFASAMRNLYAETNLLHEFNVTPEGLADVLVNHTVNAGPKPRAL